MNNKKNIFLIFLIFVALSGNQKVIEAFEFVKSPLALQRVLAEIRGTKLELLVSIPKGSHVYSVKLESDHGPEATKVFFLPEVEVKASDIHESKPITIFDQTFETQILAHKNELILEIELGNSPKNRPLKGYIQYQICDNFICSMPQKIYFNAY